MAMRGWLLIPEGGLSVTGVSWAAGPREIRDEGWFNLLKSRGARVLTSDEYVAEQQLRGSAPDLGSSAPARPPKKPRTKKVKS
jgi:hypothetical protein